MSIKVQRLSCAEVAGNTPGDCKKSRGWSITINNPTSEEIFHFKSFTENNCVHGKFQIEKGEENGTEHLQGCIYFKNERTFNSMKRTFPRAHIERARNYSQLEAYCGKAKTRIGEPWEFGKKPRQGERTDLAAIGIDIVSGAKTSSDIAKEQPEFYIKYHRGLKALEYEIAKHREVKPINIWIFGPAGVGKSSYVFKKHGTKNVYVKDGTQWWDGYRGEPVILIDDFDGKWPFRDLLRLLDWYPYQGQTKGSYIKLAPEYIYITCEKSPEEIAYSKYNENPLMPDENIYLQLGRRLDKIYRMNPKENKSVVPEIEDI